MLELHISYTTVKITFLKVNSAIRRSRLAVRRKPDVVLHLAEGIRGRRLERLDGARAERLGQCVREALVDGSKDAELARGDLGVLDRAHVPRKVVNEMVASGLVQRLVVKRARLLKVKLGDHAQLVASEPDERLMLDLLVVVDLAREGQRCDRALVVGPRTLWKDS